MSFAGRGFYRLPPVMCRKHAFYTGADDLELILTAWVRCNRNNGHETGDNPSLLGENMGGRRCLLGGNSVRVRCRSGHTGRNSALSAGQAVQRQSTGNQRGLMPVAGHWA